MGMQSSSVLSGQLSLDFNEGLLTTEVSGRAPTRQIKSILFQLSHYRMKRAMPSGMLSLILLQMITS